MSYLFNIQDRSYMVLWCWMSIGKTFCSELESNEENAGKSCDKYEMQLKAADVVLSQGIKVPKWNVLTFVVKIHQMLFYQIIWQWYFTWASQPWKGFFISHKFQHMITHTGKTFQKKTSSSCCFLHSLNWFIRDSCIYSYLLDIQWTSQRQGRGGQKEKSKTERDRRREGLCSLSQASQAASESHDNI